MDSVDAKQQTAMNTDNPGLHAPPKRDLLREALFLLNVYTQKPRVVATFLSVVALVASIFTCLIVYTYQYYAARRRRRENALAVRLAENAPVNDEWEFEMEKHIDVMRAAPSESEEEEAERVSRGV